MRAAVLSTAPAPALAAGEPSLCVKALLVTLPVTSFLALPFIQGSTPANLLVYLILFPLSGLLLLPEQGYAQLVRRMAWWMSVVAALFLLSRLSHINGLVDGMGRLNVINERTALPFVPLSTITQTLYLIAGVMVFKLTASLYRPDWDRWIFAGAWFMLIYGFIDWGAESFGDLNLDFLANRTFKEGAFDLPGSLRQHLPLMGWQMMRFKSFTGEASMYAISALPYLYLAIVRGRRLLAGLLLLSLVLTMSTVAYSGLVALALCLTFRIKRPLQPWQYLVFLVGLSSLVALVFLNFDGIKDIIDRTFVAKLSGADESGFARGSSFRANINYWAAPDTPWMVRLFGLGFGTIRSTDLLSTLLVNVGLVGCAAALAWVLSLLGTAWSAHKRLGVAVFSCIFLLMLGAVPEFAYLPPWLLAGLLQSNAFKESA